MGKARLNDFDVTGTVQVSSTAAVREAVEELCHATWQDFPFEPLTRAFDQFDRMFAGNVPDYYGVDTVYHDRQHTLDVTLALARLVAGYDRSHAPAEQLGAERAAAGLVIGLFHDVGYLRRKDDSDCRHGAELTRVHVSRGAEFLADYLPRIQMSGWAPVAREVIHYTGYEVPFDRIVVADPKDKTLGHLIGTADMIGQMADRCYLEKCRDRLYPEFVLGGMALPISSNGGRQVRYASGLDVLRQTPEFVAETRAKRLDGAFNGAYHNVEALYGGHNPYMDMIERNLGYLNRVLRSENWRLLRRNPQVFSALDDPMATVRNLMVGYIRNAWAQRR
ncbi:MAG TPA: HD domain-containing protein [Steroidobacteraceae bacterium]|nr:HD domain-containing protein [Steroidobacteraceae bacterium]